MEIWPQMPVGVLNRSLGRALEWHSRGQRFDPAYLHQRKTLKPYWAEKIPIFLDISTLLRMSQLDLARTLTESIVKNGYFQDIATGRNAAFTTGRSSWGLLYLIFA